MTAKRFDSVYYEDFCRVITDNGREVNPLQVVELLNELHEENQQIKDLIHTMLSQIDAENITSDSAMYSARIIFSKNEFNLIRELWKRS